MVDEDGQLKPALRRLADAVSGLADPKPYRLEHATTWLDPLYCQLRDSLPGQQGSGGTNTGYAGCFIPALDLLAEIDGTVQAWVWTRGVVFDSMESATIERLRHLEQRNFRPQDVHGLDQISQACEQWATAITELLGVGPVDICLNLYQRGATPAACPACSERWAYSHDCGGQLVRNPALQIRVGGCRCARCKATWGVDQFQFLARLLGCIPE